MDYEMLDYDSEDEVITPMARLMLSCPHSQKGELDYDAVICLRCGLEFEEETFQARIGHKFRQSSSDWELEHHDMREDEDEDEEPQPPSSEPEQITVTSVKQLKDIAKQHKVKYYSRMSSEELCKVLNAKIVKSFKIMIVNKETGEQRGFHSINQAAKELKVNPGLIHHYIGREMT